MRLRNKVAIITGGGSGIGQATALLFAEEGAKVVIADVDAVAGHKTASTITQKKGDVHFSRADISQEEQARAIADETVRVFGKVDILVNNAAVFVLKGIDASVEDWRRSLSVNVIGTSLVTKHAIEPMKKGGGGTIVNLASISSWVAQANLITYSATKGALLQMTRNMAMDFAPHNIRVNCVCPGSIITSATHQYMEETGKTLEQVDAEEGAKTFLKRAGKASEVAYAILFLASDEASYITGAHLMVDGGYTAM
jgi:NAD(P)-dependent dehydrogenase (short-subunit alcohol dehydrogenase family)